MSFPDLQLGLKGLSSQGVPQVYARCRCGAMAQCVVAVMSRASLTCIALGLAGGRQPRQAACARRDHEVKYVIDAGEIGGVARYMNHSCDVRALSNCKPLCCSRGSWLSAGVGLPLCSYGAAGGILSR